MRLHIVHWETLGVRGKNPDLRLIVLPQTRVFLTVIDRRLAKFVATCWHWRGK